MVKSIDLWARKIRDKLIEISCREFMRKRQKFWPPKKKQKAMRRAGMLDRIREGNEKFIKFTGDTIFKIIFLP